MTQLFKTLSNAQIGKRSRIVKIKGNTVIFYGLVKATQLFKHLTFFKIGTNEHVIAYYRKVKSGQCFFKLFKVKILFSYLVPCYLAIGVLVKEHIEVFNSFILLFKEIKAVHDVIKGRVIFLICLQALHETELGIFKVFEK